jgi:hypothetical protein
MKEKSLKFIFNYIIIKYALLKTLGGTPDYHQVVR